MKAFSIFVFLGKLGLSPIHIDSIYNMLCEKKERVWAISCCPLALVLLFLILSQREREREREREDPLDLLREIVKFQLVLTLF